MYHLIGIISDEKVLGLGSILDYMNENLFSEGGPATNEHHYHITKNNTTKKRIKYTIDKTKTYNIKYNRYTDERYYNKKRNVENNITHSTGKKHYLIMNMWQTLKTFFLLKTVLATIMNPRLLMLKTIYIKGLVIEHSITPITYITNTHIQLMLLIIRKATKFQIYKEMCYKLIGDVVFNKRNAIHANDNINVTKINKFVNF